MSGVHAVYARHFVLRCSTMLKQMTIVRTSSCIYILLQLHICPLLQIYPDVRVTLLTWTSSSSLRDDAWAGNTIKHTTRALAAPNIKVVTQYSLSKVLCSLLATQLDCTYTRRLQAACHSLLNGTTTTAVLTTLAKRT